MSDGYATIPFVKAAPSTEREHPVTTIIRPTVNLYDCDGNAFAILARVRDAFRAAGILPEWEAFRTELTAGDYDNLLATIGTRCEVVWERERTYCDDCGEARYNAEGICPECGYEGDTEPCVECGQMFASGDLNHNSQCCDCEWDEEWANSDDEDD